MTPAVALACPSCKRVLEADAWRDTAGGECRACNTEFFAFPALYATRGAVAPQTAAPAADSTCFFHPENRTEAVCEQCGRFLCAICAVPFAGQKVCPTCISAQRNSGAAPAVRERTLFSSAAVSLAILPLIAWPVTLVTAPIVLGLACYGWNTPGSLVRGRGRWKLVVAGVFALAEIAGWITFFSFLHQRG
jgi:hypothetical protein